MAVFRLWKSAMLLMKTLVLLCLVCFSTAATTDDGTECDGIRNCSEATFAVCIKYYKELELYVKGSTVIINELKSAFFFTGDYPSNWYTTFKFLLVLIIQQVLRTALTKQVCTFGVIQLFTYLAKHWYGPHFLPWIYLDIE